MRYKIGTKEGCPLTNINMLGVTFPRLTGPPGGTQTEGTVVELGDKEVRDLREAIDAREVRQYKGSAAVCLATDSEEGRPVVVRRLPLSACVYLLDEDNDEDRAE